MEWKYDDKAVTVRMPKFDNIDVNEIIKNNNNFTVIDLGNNVKSSYRYMYLTGWTIDFEYNYDTKEVTDVILKSGFIKFNKNDDCEPVTLWHLLKAEPDSLDKLLLHGVFKENLDIYNETIKRSNGNDKQEIAQELLNRLKDDNIDNQIINEAQAFLTDNHLITEKEADKFLGGTVPLGYKIVNQEYTLDEEKAPYVKKVFSMYASSKSVVEICQYLNDRGIKSSLGATFNNNSLHHMLKNERYLGTYIYKDVVIPNRIPQIIDKDLFDTVQKILIENKKNPARKRAKEEYILLGKLFCGHCRDNGVEEEYQKMVGHSGNSKKKYCYYKCKNEKNCGKKMVGKQLIEEYVLEKCKSILTDKNINQIAKKINAIAQKDNANLALIQLQKQLNACMVAKNNQLKALDSCDDDTIRQEIFARIKELKAEIEGLESSIAVERTKTLGLNEEEIRFFLTQFREYDILNATYRKALINMLVNRIYLYDDFDGNERKGNARITIILNAGKDTVEITDELYADIKKNAKAETVCILDDSGHQ